MAELSDADLEDLRGVARRASDEALDRLIAGLPGSTTATAFVKRLFARERAERGARRQTFAPLQPFIEPGLGLVTPRLAGDAEHRLWSLARTLHPELCAQLTDCWSEGVGGGAGASAIADDLCRRLGRALVLAPHCDARIALDQPPGGTGALSLLLSLAPSIRAAIPKLGTWTHQLTAKSAAELRTAFGAAAKLGEEAGPLFIEAAAGHLDEPCHVLRLISLILDQPTADFLAGSALGPLTERLLLSVERGVGQVSAFAPGAPDGDGSSVGAAVMAAAATLLEFEQWVEVGRTSAWGVRLALLRRTLAVEVELHLNRTPKIMAEALPTRSARWTQRSALRTPKLGRDPDPQAVARASDHAAFLSAIRHSPSTSGFAALLAKQCADVDDQLDSYVEGLLDLLHRATPEDRPRLQAYLDVAAQLTERFGGEPAGRIVRRRAAAA